MDLLHLLFFLSSWVLAPAAHTILELVACVMTVIGFGLDVAGLLRHFDPGPAGMTLCYLIRGSTVLIAASNGAITSIVMHTLDRYWRIVHPIHHRKHYRRWMFYVGLVVPWVNGFATSFLTQIGTTFVINGRCYLTISWTPTTTKVRLLYTVCNRNLRGLSVNRKTSLRQAWSCRNIYVIYDVMLRQHGIRMLLFHLRSPWLQPSAAKNK